MPTIAIEPSSSQKHGRDVQSYSSAQQCAPPWMLIGIVVQLLQHRLRLSGHMHLKTASATAAMSLKFRTCKVPSQYRRKCRGFVRQRVLLHRPLDYLCESAEILAIRTKTHGRTCNAKPFLRGESTSYKSMSPTMQEAQRLDGRRKTISREPCVS